MVIVHEVLALSTEHFLDLVTCTDEASSHFLDLLSLMGWGSTTSLHGDDAKVVLLANPHKQVLGIVVEDTTAIRPMATHARSKQKGGVRLLEQVTALAEGILFLDGHPIWFGWV